MSLSLMADLAPKVLRRLTCGREALGGSLYDLCFLAGDSWGEQVAVVLGRTSDVVKPYQG